MDRSRLLRLAYGLGDNEVSQMAFALGWPTLDLKKWARVRWQSPYRNSADYADGGRHTMAALAESGALVAPGFTGEALVPEDTARYRLTDLGIAVLRLALHAERDARKLGGEE